MNGLADFIASLEASCMTPKRDRTLVTPAVLECPLLAARLDQLLATMCFATPR
jgi:hypothetical protein